MSIVPHTVVSVQSKAKTLVTEWSTLKSYIKQQMGPVPQYIEIQGKKGVARFWLAHAEEDFRSEDKGEELVHLYVPTKNSIYKFPELAGWKLKIYND